MPKTTPKRGRKRKPLLDRLQNKLEITRRQAHRLEKKGVTEEDVDDLYSVKLRRAKLECDKLEQQIGVLSGKFVSRAEVRDHFIAAFTATKGELLQWDSILPAQLVGLTEAKMQPKIRALVEETLGRLAAKQYPEE